MQCVSVVAGADAPGVSPVVNTSVAGKVVFLLALQPTNTFAAGTRHVVTLNFAVVSAATGLTPISLVDAPLSREITDADANDLAMGSEDGQFVLNGGMPSLNITPGADGSSVMLSWPLTAPGFGLEAGDDLLSTNLWNAIATPASAVGVEYQVNHPVDAPAKFFRLKRP